MAFVTGVVTEVMPDIRALVTFRDGLHTGKAFVDGRWSLGEEVDVEVEDITDWEPGSPARHISIRKRGVLVVTEERVV